jgi:hypothetical protein
LNETAFCCTISTCSVDDRASVGKIAACFDLDILEGLLTSLGNTSGRLDESGPFFGNTFEGAVVDGIFFGHVPVHFEVDRIFLVKGEVCFGLNGCAADVRSCSTAGCTDVRSPVCASSFALDVSGAQVC